MFIIKYVAVSCCYFDYSHLQRVLGDCGTLDSDKQWIKVWIMFIPRSNGWESITYIAKA